MNAISFSRARNSLKRLCDEVRASRQPQRIARRSGDVVVVAAEDWDSIAATLELVAIPGAVARIKRAKDFKPLANVTREDLARLIRR